MIEYAHVICDPLLYGVTLIEYDHYCKGGGPQIAILLTPVSRYTIPEIDFCRSIG